MNMYVQEAWFCCELYQSFVPCSQINKSVIQCTYEYKHLDL